MLYKKQAAFCPICGQKDEYEFSMSRPITCSKGCYAEYEWRYVLYVMGKEYYSKPVEN